MRNQTLKLILLTLALYIAQLSAISAQIVYPKSENVIINSPRTFFIGNEDPNKTLKINGTIVKIHESGGFKHTVPLIKGENIFIIDNGEEIQTYTIINNLTEKETPELSQTIYEKPFIGITKTDNVPIRSIPYDGGLNRLQHYSKGMPLKIIGEYGDFYKVQLARDDYIWVSKKHIIKTEQAEQPTSELISYDYSENEAKRTFKLKLNKKLPYILSETNGLDLVVFGVEKQPYNKYEFHINKTGTSFGYNSYYTEDNTLVVEVKKTPVINKEAPLKGLKIAIDPGHGGAEYGTIGCLGGKEKDNNLAISLKIQKKLKEAGANVFMTRSNDKYVGLYERVELTNKNNCDLFISIHNNALPDRLADKECSGTEVYYFYPQSKALAKSVLKAITTEAETKDNGAIGGSFAVIRNTQCPAILIEVAYKISPEDNWRLINNEFQNKVAEAILHGLENYLNGLQ